MPKQRSNWLTAQQTAVVMNTTSAEICRLLSLGRLSGSKQKQAGRPGNGQWLVDPKSVAKEKRRLATRATTFRKSARSLAKLRTTKRKLNLRTSFRAF